MRRALLPVPHTIVRPAPYRSAMVDYETVREALTARVRATNKMHVSRELNLPVDVIRRIVNGKRVHDATVVNVALKLGLLTATVGQP